MATERDFLTASSTASVKLSEASAKATNFGRVDFAIAADKTNYIILEAKLSGRKFDFLVANPQFENAVNKLEQQIAAGPTTGAFKCKADYDVCMRDAKDKSDKALCLITFASCLAERYVRSD